MRTLSVCRIGHAVESGVRRPSQENYYTYSVLHALCVVLLQDCVAFDPTSEMNNRCTSFSISAQRMHIHCTGGRGLPQQ